MIIGRVGTDPDMRYTSNGHPVTTFRVAVSRQWKDSSGDMREETEWFSIVTWNKLAEICHQHLGKNTRVYLEGRLQTRSWEDQQSGQTRYKTEVVASDMIMLDSRHWRESQAQTPNGEPLTPPRGSHSVRSPQRAEEPVADSDSDSDDLAPPLDIGDDDIPY
jgi:single-strand DNA-binding protein